MTTTATAYTLPIRVYWEDTDAGGIVFYANYLRFFERARTEWLRALGIGQQQLREKAAGMFIVTHARTDYLHPARLDDVLHVSARVQTVGRASLMLHQQAWLQPQPPHPPQQGGLATVPCGLPHARAGEQPGQQSGTTSDLTFPLTPALPGAASAACVAAPVLVCEGQVRIGWVDAATLRPARIPPQILERLAP